MKCLIVTMGLCLLILATGCYRKIMPSSNKKDILKIGSETGDASYYTDRFQGLPTSSGETYDSVKLTAAHKTLPFGTWIVVTSVTNNKTVKVKINDRGPYVNGRILDLSKAAAKQLDMLCAGIMKVRIRYGE